MPENHSRADKRVERVAITDEPHDRYRRHDPWTGERLKVGIPILKGTPHGNIIEKDVTHKVVECPECQIEARYTNDSQPVCPECGIICSSNGELTREIVIDAKAAGRIDSDDAETSA